MHIFFSAGEPSGDMHAANLLVELKRRDPRIRGVGYAGPRFAAAGGALHEDMMALAVVGIGPVVWNIFRFLRLLWLADRYFRDFRPDAVVLVDFPGFNWLIARRARKRKIPVFYFSPPQIWGWARWRVRKMRSLVDLVLCGLPFEEEWLQRHGCRAVYVGHPYFDELSGRVLDRQFLEDHRSGEAPLIALLPGSRTGEVHRNLPLLLDSARRVRQQVPGAQFAFACYQRSHADLVREALVRSDVPMAVHHGRTPELIHLARACLAVSGSVSLELLHEAKPSVIIYRASWVLYLAQFLFRRVKYITLVNLLNSSHPLDPPDLRLYDPGHPDASRVLFPEYVTAKKNLIAPAAHLIRWLTDDVEYACVREKLQRLRMRVAMPGAGAMAARLILEWLQGPMVDQSPGAPRRREAG